MILRLSKRLPDSTHNVTHHAPIAVILPLCRDKPLRQLPTSLRPMLAERPEKELPKLSAIEKDDARNARGKLNVAIVAKPL
jgi:hypothetical protein